MNYTLEIIHHQRYIKYTHQGLISIAEIGKAWDDLLQLPEFTLHNYNLLTDYRNGVPDFSIKDIDLIISNLSKIKDIIDGKKQAFLVAEPHSTAISMVFEGDVYEKTGFICNTFTTETAANYWLSE